MVAALFGCVTGGDQDGGSGKLGFLSGLGGTDLESIKGSYISTLDLEGGDYAADAADQERDLTLALTNELGVFESDGLDRYVNSVLRKIAAAAAEKGRVTGFKPRAVVYADANPNAFAMPSGIILLSHGLLERMENEDQLAFVLAHESSHALLRHHDKDWFLTSQQHAVSTGEVGIRAMGEIERATGSKGIGDDAKKWQNIGNGILYVSRDLIVPGWSRNQEDQADLLGIDLVAAAGYQPRSAIGVIDMMAAMQSLRETAAKSSERMAAEQALRDTAPASAAGTRFMGQFLDMAGQAIDQTVAAAKASYRAPEERKALVRDYARREYRAVRAEATEAPYKSALSQPATKALLTRYGFATDALRKLGERQSRAALDAALKGVEGATSRHSYTRLVLSKAYVSLGNRPKAVESLQIALTGPQPALHAYLSLAEMDARQRQFAKATAVLQKARKQYPTSALAVVHLVSVHARAGKRSDAEALAVQCRLQFPEVKDRCDEAAKGRGPLDASA